MTDVIKVLAKVRHRISRMSENEEDFELLAVRLQLHSYDDPKLLLLSKEQQERTRTPLRTVWEYFRLVVLRQPNSLEQFVLRTEPNDCSLVAKFSNIVEIDLRQSLLSINSISVNTMHIQHPLVNFLKKGGAEKLEELNREVEELPIFVFVHGLGGQMSNFEPLMGLLSQCLEVMSIDLPGFGILRRQRGRSITDYLTEEQAKLDSSWRLMLWEDFETDKLVEILQAWINQRVPSNKKIVLIGHLMGTHLVIKLAAKLEENKVEGMILLSPPPLAENNTSVKVHLPLTIKLFSYVPKVFDIFRVWDRIKGLRLHLVLRQLTSTTLLLTRLRQFRWNLDVDSPVVLRYMQGFRKATYDELALATSRYNDSGSTPNTTNQKTLILCGADDVITPSKYSRQAAEWLNTRARREISTFIEILQAGHSLLLNKPEFVSGTVLDHIERHYPERLHLSPTWVLSVKAKISGDKWGLKNEEKWRRTQLISRNITRRVGNAVEYAPLLAMKTLKEGDCDHLPQVLEARFYEEPNTAPVEGVLVAVIDISLDVPVYNPSLFQRVKYVKCPTVSKVVPDRAAIRRFIAIVDDLLETSSDVKAPLIAVHCHYGQNRTIFCCCCYLIERLGWTIEEAIEAFAVAKPPGIKHPHFIDALYVRYEDQ